MKNDPRTAPAWAWVLQHSRLIERAAKRFAIGTSIPREELRSELIADLAAVFGKYDPARSAPSTWIWMRASKVRRGLVRAAIRGSAAPLPGAEAGDHEEYRRSELPAPVGSRGHVARAEAQAEIVILLDRASPAQRAAALSVLRGWDPAEVRARLGISIRERDAVVRTVGGAS